MENKKSKKLPKLDFNLSFSERINCTKKEIAIRTEEEINQYKKLIGYRKARMKRYGESSTSKIKKREDASQKP